MYLSGLCRESRLWLMEHGWRLMGSNGRVWVQSQQSRAFNGSRSREPVLQVCRFPSVPPLNPFCFYRVGPTQTSNSSSGRSWKSAVCTSFSLRAFGRSLPHSLIRVSSEGARILLDAWMHGGSLLLGRAGVGCLPRAVGAFSRTGCNRGLCLGPVGLETAAFISECGGCWRPVAPW